MNSRCQGALPVTVSTERGEQALQCGPPCASAFPEATAHLVHAQSFPQSPTELFCFVFMINLGILKMVCNGISGMQPHHITWYPPKGGAGGRAWLLHKDWEVIFIQEPTEVESQGSCLSCGSPRGDMNRFSSFTVCWAQKSVSEDTRKHFRNPQFSLAP